MQNVFLTNATTESWHGGAIEDYFIRKSGRFEPAHRAVAGAACGLFLCFTNRCGSTLIAAEASSLGYCGQPNAYRNYEFFNADFVTGYCDRNAIYDLQGYVEAIFAEFSSPLGIFFTKGSLDQLAWLRRAGVIGVAFPTHHYLRVTRNDLVAQAVSFVIAEQTGRWTSLHPETDAVIHYDADRIAAALAYFSPTITDAGLYFSLIDAEPAHFLYEEARLDLSQVGARLQRLTGIAPLPRAARTLDLQRQSRPENQEWARRFRDEALAARGIR
jgi:trehalose 2-sulfotransferase